MFGRSQAIVQIREFVNKVARSKSAVLIVGETGVGKDVVAAEIHRHSDRKGRYIPVNCSAFGGRTYRRASCSDTNLARSPVPSIVI
jgi:transcriptional regulator with GAF, ATPase, and Fis domain